MFKEEFHPFRVPNTTVLRPPPDGIPTKSTQVAELTLEEQDVREVLLEVMEDKSVGNDLLRVERLWALLDPRWKVLGAGQLVNGTAALRTRAEEDMKGVIAEFADAQTQPPAPVPAPVLDVEPAKPALKKKRLSKLEERREARVRAAVGGGGDSVSADPQAAVTGRRVLIGREVLTYLAEQGQLDVDAFNLLGFWNRRGTDSVCPTTSTITSPAEISYLAFIARLYHGIEATSCQAERYFSSLARLIGDLRSRMLVSKVGRMMFIQLNRHLIDEVRELDVAVAQARARVAKSTQKSVTAQEERLNMSVDLTVKIPRMVMWIVSVVCLPLVSLFSAFFLCLFAVLGVILRYQWYFFYVFCSRGCLYSFKMKHDNRSFACCFYLEFWHENAKPKVRRKKGWPFVRAPKTCG